jgi:S-DNA-T family DNA segregation ATPase FtsK/SpoIIIE
MSVNIRAYLIPTEHRRLNEFIGLVLATAALLFALALISYNPDDPSFNISRNPNFSARPSNLIGVTGAYFADSFFQLFGFSSFLMPVFVGIYAFCWLASRPVELLFIRATGMLLLALTISATLALFPSLPRVRGHIPAGGFLGQVIADNLESLVNPAGSVVILLAAFLISLFLATTFSFTWAVEKTRPRLAFAQRFASWYRDWQERRELAALHRRVEERKAARAQLLPAPDEFVEAEREPAAPVAQAPPPPPVRVKPAPITITPRETIDVTPKKASKKNAPAAASTPTDVPPTSLLHPPVALREINEAELRQRATLLQQKAGEFEVEGSVQQIHPGPVVTTFEFKPEPGVKYARITGLADDLCLALEAESVRIDRIPGKATVGIEVPNDERATIVLRELLESAEYIQSNYRLPLALGKDITGKNIVSDLQKMPHLLMAGSTGTGKSVSINAMILSLLYRARPDQVKMIMIDPKRLELGLYQDIPHLLVPVVTEPKVAQNVLRWAVGEMEGRYKKLATRGVRTLEAYNEQVRQLDIPGMGIEQPEGEEPPVPLPYIVIIIDELADLMMTAAREVEESIARLAQMARAVGIHLILATQRPSVDVITGLIKNNFPSRISFRVVSKVDSRTILDSNGAEQLLGRGDMLFLAPGASRLMRVHGPLVTEEEVARAVEFLKAQGKPIYNQRILESPEENEEVADGDGELDEVYDDAVRIVIEMGKGSTSALQRRLRIGYGRAASLLDAMQRAGIVGPPDGSKPRVVLIKKEDYFTDE